MCRLAYFPKGTKISKKRLVGLLAALEKSMGGHGTGVAVCDDNGGYKIVKALDMKVQHAADVIHQALRDGHHAYFHTRLVSVGWREDEQCHPHEAVGPAWRGFVVHNGTWSDGATLAKYLGVASDTMAFARCLADLGPKTMDARKITPSSGVWLLFGNKPGATALHQVMLQSGDLEFCEATGIWASEFPFGWHGKTYDVASGLHDMTKPAPESKFVKYKYNSRSNYVGGGAITSATTTFKPAAGPVSSGTSQPREGMSYPTKFRSVLEEAEERLQKEYANTNEVWSEGVWAEKLHSAMDEVELERFTEKAAMIPDDDDTIVVEDDRSVGEVWSDRIVAKAIESSDYTSRYDD
jgi:hypothetical protein